MTIRTFSQYVKNVCMKICEKTLRTTQNLFNNWGKSNPSGKKTALFLCDVVASKVWCYIQATVTCKMLFAA